MLENLTELLLPALLLLAGAAGIAKKQDVYGGMLTGAQDGLRLMLSLTPTLVLMLTAVTMLRESGFFALLTPVFAPVFRLLGIPPEVAPLVLIRPLSGSAALAVGTDLMRQYGVDSTIPFRRCLPDRWRANSEAWGLSDDRSGSRRGAVC